MVKVSVIVPVYNVESYLEECLDSLINQTLTDIEIICINDGSTDKSLDILREYEKNDSRIKCISKENGGLSSARNAGLANVTGEYISFLDSDDYLELTALEELYTVAKKDALDLVIFKLINFDEDTKEKSVVPYHEMAPLKNQVKDAVFSHKDILNQLVNLDVSVCTKFFKKELISDLRFLEGKIFEDNLFVMDYIFNANKIYFYDKHLYLRRVRPNSIITAGSKSYMDVIYICNEVLNRIKESGYYDELKVDFTVKKIYVTFMRYSQVKEEYKAEFFNEIKADFEFYQQEYIENDIYQSFNFNIRNIFDSALCSDTYKEFELNIEYNKLNSKSDNLKKKLKKEKKNYKKLKKENSNIKKELDELYSSNSWKLTKPLRNIKNK